MHSTSRILQTCNVLDRIRTIGFRQLWACSKKQDNPCRVRICVCSMSCSARQYVFACLRTCVFMLEDNLWGTHCLWAWRRIPQMPERERERRRLLVPFPPSLASLDNRSRPILGLSWRQKLAVSLHGWCPKALAKCQEPAPVMLPRPRTGFSHHTTI